ncbi:MAG: sugar-binding domain-containing protein, partial [Phocaeicola sp.]
MRKQLLLTLFVMLGATSNLWAQLSFGEAQKINEQWKFTLQNPENAHQQRLNDKNWQSVTLPHDWSVKGQLSPTLASCTGYLPGGIGWYRKRLEVPEERNGQKVFIYFEGVYNRSEVFVNGELVGSRPNGYISFAYDITDKVAFGKTNTIAVKVDHSMSADSRWYTGSGIYRNVFIVYANPLHIAQWGVFAYPKTNNKLNIETEVVNESKVTETITVKNELL